MVLFLTRDAFLRFSIDERRPPVFPVGEAERSGRSERSGLFSEPKREGEARSSQKVRGERCCWSGDESKGDESLLVTIFWRKQSASDGSDRIEGGRLTLVAWL